MPIYISEISILVAALLAVAFFIVWYSDSLFSETNSLNFNQVKKPYGTILSYILVYIVFFSVVAFFLPEPGTALREYVELGVLLIAFMATHATAMLLKEKKPVSRLLVDLVFYTIIVTVGISVMALWPW